MAKGVYNDVKVAFYEKGVARVSMMSTVDDMRRPFGTILAAPPCTPIDTFLKNHEEEIKEAMDLTQMMITEGVKTVAAPHLTLQNKFEKLRKQFEATKPTQEEVEEDLNEIRGKSTTDAEPELPKPRVPVYDLIIAEASTYMQEVMDFIMVHVLK